jgi:methylmalonyl-CoA mutase cobalamin-binding subunit
MQQGFHLKAAQLGEGPLGGVSHFAAEVVARLVSRDPARAPALKEQLLERFIAAVSSLEAQPFEVLKPELRRARVSAEMLADFYIPEVARRLGEAWEQDCLSFAQVTMGVARLQAILREIGSSWSADVLGPVDGPTLLVVLPQGEQHTLGAMVLSGRLRRMGISVSMRIAPALPELAAFVAARGFDGALISIASHDRLESCRRVVKTLKEASMDNMKVAIGGAIQEDVEEVIRLTGADLATNDIFVALRGMGVLLDASQEMEAS